MRARYNHVDISTRNCPPAKTLAKIVFKKGYRARAIQVNNNCVIIEIYKEYMEICVKRKIFLNKQTLYMMYTYKNNIYIAPITII